MGSATPRKQVPQAPTSEASYASHLKPLAGRWHVEGDVEATSHGPASKWTSEEHADWLPGERFLVNRWDAKVGERGFRGMAVFGHDPDSGFFATFYDNAGHHPTYDVTIEGLTWQLIGDAQRATFEFSGDGKTVHIRWESRGDKGWEPLCDLTGTRVTTH